MDTSGQGNRLLYVLLTAYLTTVRTLLMDTSGQGNKGQTEYLVNLTVTQNRLKQK